MTWLWIVLAIILIVLGWGFGVYNKLVVLRNKKDDQWSQIDVQLKRRSDLIPNLVETVKGYVKHEEGTLEAVIKARNSMVSAKTPEDEIKADGELTGALNKLFALSEAYPDLKANTNFIELQKELKETEDKISYARQFYNDAVLSYNNKVQMVPSNIIASIAKFEKAVFFEATETEKETPKVSF